MSTAESEGTEPEANEPVLGYATAHPAPFAAVVWSRILALWMFAWGLYEGAAFLASLALVFAPGSSLGPALTQVVVSAIGPSIWLFMAWYCWNKAPDLARKLAAGAESPDKSRGMSSNELIGVIIVGIGIYLLAEGLPTLAWVVTVIIQNIRNSVPPSELLSLYERNVIGGLVRCALGIWLILGTGGLVDRVRRYSGRWRDESPAADSNPSR